MQWTAVDMKSEQGKKKRVIFIINFDKQAEHVCQLMIKYYRISLCKLSDNKCGATRKVHLHSNLTN